MLDIPLSPADRIIFALDVPNHYEASRLISLLEPHVGGFKVGLELFVAEGPSILKLFNTNENTNQVVLDLKLHDIPETVERTTKVIADKGAQFFTVQYQQLETLERVAKIAQASGITPLCVTVLTSIGQSDLTDLNIYMDIAAIVEKRVRRAMDCGINGFVCSPQEVGFLRKMFPSAFFMVPGVRPAKSDAGDQKRMGTPGQTVKDGANLIVVGRPIRDAKDPVEAANAIAKEIESTQ